MNGHDRHEDNILPSEILPEDHPATPGAQMETRTQVSVQGPGALGQPLVDRIETTGLGGNGLGETVEVRLTYAPGCHHILHVGAEAGAFCADGCGRLICASCAAKAENLCMTCRRPVAGPCQQRPLSAPEGTVQCRECRSRGRGLNLLIFMIVIIVVGAILMLIVAAISQIRIPF
jgi:hypothetical protein